MYAIVAYNEKIRFCIKTDLCKLYNDPSCRNLQSTLQIREQEKELFLYDSALMNA